MGLTWLSRLILTMSLFERLCTSQCWIHLLIWIISRAPNSCAAVRKVRRFPNRHHEAHLATRLHAHPSIDVGLLDNVRRYVYESEVYDDQSRMHRYVLLPLKLLGRD